MALTENLISDLVFTITGQREIIYQDQKIDFNVPFKRITLKEALQQYAQIDIDSDLATLKKKALELKLDPRKESLRGELINYIYDKAVEKHLIQPTFIIDYPWETSPLAKRKSSNPEYVERFELIINAMEIANAFSELNDPLDQYQRFQKQEEERQAGWEEAHKMDEDFIQALKYGMPPTGGLGIGIDRIVMLLTNQPSIRDVIFFPHMRTN
jgi:lysyl-tRNA synthetase class 2